MTVAELRAILATLPDDLPVFFENYDREDGGNLIAIDTVARALAAHVDNYEPHRLDEVDETEASAIPVAILR